jgi:hypothetical protein
MRHLDEVMPTDAVWDDSLTALAGELAVLHARLGAVEAAVGRPRPVGAPATPGWRWAALSPRVVARAQQDGAG